METRAVGTLKELLSAIGADEVDRLVCEAFGTNASDYPLGPEKLRGDDGTASIELDAFLDWRDRDDLAATIHEWLRDGTAEGILASAGWDVDRALSLLSIQLLERNDDFAYDVVNRGIVEAVDALESLVDGRTFGDVTIEARLDHDEVAVELMEGYNPYVELMSAEDIALTSCKATLLVADVPHDPNLECNASGEAVAWAAERLLDGEWTDEPEYDRPDAGGNLEWLCETQGTTLDAVISGVDGERGEFGDSLAEEVSECVPSTPGYQCLAALVTMDVRQYLTVLAGAAGRDDGSCVHLACGRGQATLGIFDPVSGAGSLLGVRLERDVSVPLGSIEAVMCEEGRGHATCSGATLYTASDTFGLAPEAWDSRVTIEAAQGEREAIPETYEPERERARSEQGPAKSVPGGDER